VRGIQIRMRNSRLLDRALLVAMLSSSWAKAQSEPVGAPAPAPTPVAAAAAPTPVAAAAAPTPVAAAAAPTPVAAAAAPTPVAAATATPGPMLVLASPASLSGSQPTLTPIMQVSGPRLQSGQHFEIDPVSDGVLIAAGGGTALLLSAILGTGEITPPKIDQGAKANLLSIDRLAVTQTIDPHASLYSNIVLGTAIGFAVLDPIISGYRDGWDALEVDAVMYGETVALTEMLTDITKIAVRRPRPIDYINCGTVAQQKSSSCASTDLGLSFFSGHASTVGSIAATASYLAFMRNSHTTVGWVRAWSTLVVGAALTGWVSYERVRSGNHFPTDVIAGSLAGAAIGVLVPHLHRHQQEAPLVVLGAAPLPGGGSMTVSGTW
jgi:membrane-associated phospholipid phosphatase